MDIVHNAEKEILNTSKAALLDNIKSKFLGKSGLLTQMLKDISKLPTEERPSFGQKVNQAKDRIQQLIQDQFEVIRGKEIAASLASEIIDITLPSRGKELGSLHPISRMRDEIEKFFVALGFAIAEGPEIEDDYHNFAALNFPEHHPARYMQDTFYFPNGLLLRTHTSPIQIREMENGKPPFRILAPGRVYRCDSDATHSPMFHQFEGLVVGENISLGNLKWMVRTLVSELFGEDTQYRFRASYFPFVEPGAELDITWKKSDGTSNWLEVGGLGMVHPNVLRSVNIDPEKYSGFAFGLGIDRLAMLRYGIDDLRLFFENDLRFLKQF